MVRLKVFIKRNYVITIINVGKEYYKKTELCRTSIFFCVNVLDHQFNYCSQANGNGILPAYVFRHLVKFTGKCNKLK